MIFAPEILKLAENVIAASRDRHLKIGTVESCTGGLIAAAITAVSGASDVFECGFVTYANEAKTNLVGVPSGLFLNVGAVSEDVARAMSEGALAQTALDAVVAVTGIAGPGGGTKDKPVGLVHLSASRRGFATLHARHVFPGDREAVRLAAVQEALRLLGELVAR
jgi:nicotinamide-nucleotide amidase